MSPDIFFHLTLTEDSVIAECWVGGNIKYSISPTAIWGAISRRKGWSKYLSLKEHLTHGIEPGDLM